MIICRTCHRAWPDDAQFCGNCQRSFGGRRCPKAHLSPFDATSCVVCQSTELSEPTKGLRTTRASRLIAWVIVLLVARFIVPLLPRFFAWLLHCLDYLLGYVFGTRPSVAMLALVPTILMLVVMGAMVYAVAPPFRRPILSLFKPLTALAKISAKALVVSLKYTFLGLRYLINGAPPFDPKKVKKLRERSK